MKEICFINKGDNRYKLKESLGISSQAKESSDYIDNHRYIVLEEGKDDIICVRNYQPYFIKNLNEGETLLDLYGLGYEVVGGSDLTSAGDCVVVKKIEGIRYVVKPLEKLEEIAQKFGVNKDDIISSNNLVTEKLFVGQILII